MKNSTVTVRGMAGARPCPCTRCSAGFAGLGIIVVASARSASAQPRTTPSAEAALECFVEYQVTGDVYAECPQEVSAVGIMLEPHKYSRALVDSVMVGLERLAITAESQKVRVGAVLWLRLPGSKQVPTEQRVSGTVARLARVYEGTEEYWTHYAVLNAVHDQVEQEEAIRFLSAAASRDLPDDSGRDFARPELALMALSRMGERGRAVLREMHEGNVLQNRIGRRVLQWLAEHDFVVP